MVVVCGLKLLSALRTCSYMYIIISIEPAQDTFVYAKSWIKELQHQARPSIVIALAGNQVDLAAKRVVDFKVGCI